MEHIPHTTDDYGWVVLGSEYWEPAIERGVAALNDYYDNDWIGRINLQNFNLSSGMWCVLGHVAGSYTNGKMELGLNETDCQEHGFIAPDYYILSGEADERSVDFNPTMEIGNRLWKEKLRELGAE